ncbi:MAG TPA: hypothetical protein VK555_00480 [Terriglobales bacterium]|nr:hypothetical protein [Terriglobales bacterium]
MTLPARELLGDLMMDQKKFTEAIAAYQHSLELYPRRFNSLLGASRAARALGNAELERKYRRELLRITGRASW